MDINPEAVREEAVGYLRDLLRINTVNPPGNEIYACQYIAGVLAREGIECTIIESAPERGNLVARLRGNGQAAALLLMVHLD
ncbi:MAG TPA: peptidase M20, partial [Anaerolineae bacterium]|nr:peptidase M20 [Anaerolineae bacterium]